jgi:hypothetical protein
MSAGTQNFDLGSLLHADRNEPTMPTRSPAARKPDSERLHIVRADEPELLYGKSLDDAAKSSRTPRQPPTKYPIEAQSAEPLKTVVELELETLPPRESGVDLALLRPADIDTAKLAAFMHDIPAAKKDGDRAASQASPGKAIVMPLAKTDLQEIFQADKICMVARPHHNTPALKDETEPKQDPPPAACPAVPPQKTPQALDETQRYLVENWPQLPPNVQAAILNVIDAAIGPDDD